MRFMLPSLGLLAIGSALCPALLAQTPVITNGDFESGLSGWTAAGGGGWPGVVTEDITGLGKSQVFSLHPGGKIYKPPHKPYILKQSVTLAAGVDYEFSADVMTSTPFRNDQGPLVEVKIGGVSVLKWQRFLLGIQVGAYREKVAGRFAQKKAGKLDLEILIQRPKYVYNSTSPRFRIDNLKLRIAPRPSVFVVGDRKIGTAISLQSFGTPKAVLALFMSPKLFPKSIAVRGFKGRLELHLNSLFFILVGSLDPKTGRGSATLRIPKDKRLLGNALYWQGVEITQSLQFSIGPAHNFNLTN